MGRRRRRLGAVSLAAGVVALVVALTASPAHAAPPEKVGWWFQPLSGPLSLPVPVPVVPEGGLFVQQGATSDPVAFGALRYRVPDGSNNSLTLTTAPGSVALAASMQACKVSSPWDAPNPSPGAWDTRPSYGNPCAPGLVSSDGAAVAFNLNASFVADGALDVAIVPLGAATPFAVAFAPPADDALQGAGGKPSSSPALPTPTTLAGAPAVSGGAVVTGGSPIVAAPGRAPAVAPVVAAAPASSSRSAVADGVLNVVGLGDPDRGARALALGGASLIVVGWWLLSTRTVPLPRLLGAMGGAVGAAGAGGGDPATADPPGEEIRVGGVGRFARPRDRNPLTLR